MVLDPVPQESSETKAMVQVYARKKVLDSFYGNLIVLASRV